MISQLDKFPRNRKFLLADRIENHTLDQLEALLDPEQFFRVNRKYYISLGVCKKIYSWSNSRLKKEVDGLDDEIVVARERVSGFKEWLDG